jgi:hypothetical protein
MLYRMERNPDWNVFLNMAALCSTTLSTALLVLVLNNQ